MAERERQTNKERRAAARDERKRKEAEAAQKRKRGQLRNGLITFAIVLVIGAVVLQAFTGGPETIEDAIVLSTDEVEEARNAAGCEMIAEGEPLEDRSHVESATQVDPDASYTATRPTHSGPHTVGVHPVTAAAGSQIDEISSTHNLEHGTIIAWWDPEQVDDSSAIGDWAETLNANGFRRDQAGVGIMSSPYEDPGIESGKAIAFRAWGTAMDCDEWDEDVANAFVLDHYGTHGIGPERSIAPFPDDVIVYDDVEVGDTTEEEAPTDQPDFEGIDPGETDDEVIEDEVDGDEPDDAGTDGADTDTDETDETDEG